MGEDGLDPDSRPANGRLQFDAPSSFIFYRRKYLLLLTHAVARPSTNLHSHAAEEFFLDRLGDGCDVHVCSGRYCSHLRKMLALPVKFLHQTLFAIA